MHPALLAGLAAMVLVLNPSSPPTPPSGPVPTSSGDAARASEPVTLAYAWRVGDRHRYRAGQEISATFASGGNDDDGDAPAEELSLTSTMELTVRLEVREVDASGTASASVLVEAVRARTKPPFGPEMTYDSATPDAARDEEPFAIVMGALVGAELMITIEPDGEVPTLSGTSAIWERAAAARPGVATEIRSMRGAISDESVRVILTQALHALPGTPLAVGGSCPVSIPSAGDPEVSLRITGTTTLGDIARAGGAEIATLRSDLKVAAGPADAPGLTGSGERTTTFDVSQRHVLRSESRITAASPDAADGSSKQEITMTVRLERLPMEPPPAE